MSWENIGRYRKPEKVPWQLMVVDLSDWKVLASEEKAVLYTPVKLTNVPNIGYISSHPP